MASLKGYPSWFSGSLIHILTFILFVSGCFLGPTTLTTRLEWPVPWQLASDSRVWMTAAHVLFGFLVVGVIGALWAIHMRYWWKKDKGRRSGAALLGTLVFLGLTGVAILYVGHQELLNVVSISHLTVGVALALPYIGHTIIRVKQRNRKRKS